MNVMKLKTGIQQRLMTNLGRQVLEKANVIDKTAKTG